MNARRTSWVCWTHWKGKLLVNKVALDEWEKVRGRSLGCGLALIMLGAKGFVYGIEHLAPRWGISALTLSLLLVPVATELPEKVNSILWIRRGRDTLAVGNLTGAMMFQGSLLPAVGIMLTAWVPQKEILIGMAMTLVASTYLTWLVRKGTVKPVHLVVNGLCYLGFVASVFFL